MLEKAGMTPKEINSKMRLLESPGASKSLVRAFNKHANEEQRLRAAGLTLTGEEPAPSVPGDDALVGLTFVLTGTLAGRTRDEAAAAITVLEQAQSLDEQLSDGSEIDPTDEVVEHWRTSWVNKEIIKDIDSLSQRIVEYEQILNSPRKLRDSYKRDVQALIKTAGV